MKDELVIEKCWDQDHDGKLVYHACAYDTNIEQNPLFRLTFEFLPHARRFFSDAACRRLVEELAGEQMQKSLSQLG